MFVKADVFSDAINNIQLIASLDKKQPGILLTIKEDNTIDIYYNTGVRAIIQTIDAVVEENEYHGSAIFDYKKLTDTVAYCKGSGRIKAEQIEIVMSENEGGNNTAHFKVVKTIDVTKDGNTDTIVASTNDYELSWIGTEKLNMNQRILANPACGDMFDENGATVWDTNDFVELINNTCNGNAKTVYFSPKYNGAFTVSTTSSTLMRSKSKINTVISLVVPMAKAMASVIKNHGDDSFSLNVATDENDKPTSCIMFTSDKKLSVYTATALISGPDLTSMQRYSSIDYKTYQCNIIGDVLRDALKAAVNLSSNTQGGITFELSDEGGVDLVVTAENTNASVNNCYRLKCAGFYTLEPNPTEGNKIIKCPIDLKLLLEIVTAIKGEFIGIDIDVKDKAMFLRVSHSDNNVAKEVAAEYKNENNLDRKLTMEERLDLRSKSLMLSYFLPLKQG